MEALRVNSPKWPSTTPGPKFFESRKICCLRMSGCLMDGPEVSAKGLRIPAQPARKTTEAAERRKSAFMPARCCGCGKVRGLFEETGCDAPE